MMKSSFMSPCFVPNHEKTDTLFLPLFFEIFLEREGFLTHLIFVHSALSVPSSSSLNTLRSSVFSTALFLASRIVASNDVGLVFTRSDTMAPAMTLSSGEKKLDTVWLFNYMHTRAT